MPGSDAARFQNPVGEDPVVIVGAGLAGLCCARQLTLAGVPWMILEGADRVGGRVGSDEVDGFILDRGFQVFLDTYPEARRVLDYSALELRPFYPGALVRDARGTTRVAHPARRPLAALGSLGRIFKPRDAVAVFRLLRRPAGEGGPAGETTIERLRRRGMSERAIESFFRPFFGGVFLEGELNTPAAMFDFVLSMFARGRASLPARGMQAIPEQLAESLPPARIHLGWRVRSIGRGQVTTESGQTLATRAVVLATGPDVAARLLGRAAEPDWNATTTLYFAVPVAPVAEPILVLNGGVGGRVNHVCVPSQVAPSYAPAGQSLVSVSLLGASDPDEGCVEREVRAELAGWFGPEVEAWRHLRTYRIPQALPRRFALGAGAPGDPRIGDGVYACGDYLDNPSINGAMRSGRAAAEALIADLAGRQARRAAS